MVGILVKKQLAEIFKAYFYNTKKNKSRSKAGIAVMFALFAVLMVGVLGGMFTYLSFSLCRPLAQAGVGWLYFVIMSLLSILLGVFGSVFNTYSGLYLAKDNDLLLSMPIPVRAILISRLLGVYLMGLMYSGIVLLPAVIVYWIFVEASLPAIAGGLTLILCISILVLVLSCILGWVVAKISVRMKNKSFTTVAVSLIFIGLYYFFYFKAQTLLQTLISNAAVYGEEIRGAAYGLYLFGRIGEGYWMGMLILILVMLAAFAATFLVLSRTFVDIVTDTGKTERKIYKEKTVKQRSVSSALLGKEFARFTSSAGYMLNCGLGILILLAGGVMLLWKGSMVSEVLYQVFGETRGAIPVLACAALCMMASMNDMAAPSVSLEGKNLWIVNTLPVTPWQILKAKLSMQLYLTVPPLLFCSICLIPLLQEKPAIKVLVVVLALAFSVFSALFGMSLGTKRANFSWTSEMTPVKQSLAVFLTMMSGWIYALALGGIYMFGGFQLGAVTYFLIFLAATLLVSLILYLWLKKRGVKLLVS